MYCIGKLPSSRFEVESLRFEVESSKPKFFACCEDTKDEMHEEARGWIDRADDSQAASATGCPEAPSARLASRGRYRSGWRLGSDRRRPGWLLACGAGQRAGTLGLGRRKTM